MRSLVSDAGRSTRRSIPTCPAVCAVHCSSGIERRAAAPHLPKPRLPTPPARLYAHVASTPPPVTTVRPFTFIASFAIFGPAPQTSDLLALSAALLPKLDVPTLDHLMRTLPGLVPHPQTLPQDLPCLPGDFLLRTPSAFPLSSAFLHAQ